MRGKSDDFHREIAKITGTHLGFESHGIFTALIDLDYGNMSQTIGGYVMSSGVDVPVATPRAADFIIRVLRACGVARWEQLKGRTIFVLFRGGFRLNSLPDGIENLPTEKGEQFLFADWQADVRHAIEAAPTTKPEKE